MSSGAPITARTYLMGMPLWGGAAPAAHAAKIVANLQRADMMSEWGVRSTSSDDPRYSNANIIVPYSNWRGPVWINVNAILVYGMVSKSYAGTAEADAALPLARRVVAALADDLRNDSTWHECLSSATGAGLAAPGFLSWDTLGASLLADAAAKRDPFEL